MGKWAEVQCACANRIPLPDSDPFLGRPHQQKHRLTKTEEADVEEWKRTTEKLFACGHRGGLVIELCPSDIIHLGDLLATVFNDNVFEVFARVGNWRCYEDELLLIQPQEAEFWLLEIEELQKAFEGAGNLPDAAVNRLVVAYYSDDLGSRLSFEASLNEAEARFQTSAVGALKRTLQRSKRPDIESTIEKITKACLDATKLCRASLETGKPVRLMW
jgi:hypothetical protein